MLIEARLAEAALVLARHDNREIVPPILREIEIEPIARLGGFEDRAGDKLKRVYVSAEGILGGTKAIKRVVPKAAALRAGFAFDREHLDGARPVVGKRVNSGQALFQHLSLNPCVTDVDMGEKSTVAVFRFPGKDQRHRLSLDERFEACLGLRLKRPGRSG